ncbi:DNA-binding Lrp family transcriptional regulator [Acinetobacter calcoaceticus]|uniref:DNA-binding Lrp family transcriptional regulator n=1 Tax=Acinetobacter calcoaceticus TaxID=471 RepID=A0A4R1XVS0_ACICA|nr:DNA-binding Lrp family transcriptional regulator [Acinetobacter calcoaceticus]
MNNTDSQILGLLRDNARLSITALATTLRISRATVQKRIEFMEASGVITGYTVKVKPDFEKDMIRAWMHIMVEGNKSMQVIKALRVDPAVETLHTTNGKWDLLVEIKSNDLDSFDKILDRIRTITGVQSSETSILLSTYKTH